MSCSRMSCRHRSGAVSPSAGQSGHRSSVWTSTECRHGDEGAAGESPKTGPVSGPGAGAGAGPGAGARPGAGPVSGCHRLLPNSDERLRSMCRK